MGVYIPEHFGQATIRFSLTGIADPILSTFGYSWASEQGGGGTLGSVDEGAAAIVTSLTGSTSLCPASVMASGYSFVSVECLERRGGDIVPGVAPANIAGAGGASPVPVNCAGLVRKNTARTGRKGRGRMYWPPYMLTESDVSAAGVIGSSSISSMQTRLTAWLTALTTAGVWMYLLHQDETDTPNKVTSLTMQPTLATQRRRMR